MVMGGYFHDNQVPADYIKPFSVEGHDSRDAPLRKISQSAETPHEYTVEHPARMEPGIAQTNADYPRSTVPSASANDTRQEGAAKATVWLIVALCLQILAIIFLFATVGLIASASETQIVSDLLSGYAVEVKLYYSYFTPIRYTLGTAVLGSLYCIYAIISLILRLVNISRSCKKVLLWINYIGDQVVLILAVTGVTAAASSLVSNNSSDGICATYTLLCRRLAAATGALLVGSLLLVFTLVISSFYVCKRRI
ncbi:hypothetical protein KP509_37G000300 [Ceratopteris richardii]|uniref:CASP-like protein n=1 Tax=Ceratopteris richardii TaxID=49495 RepID=A0A8T2Q607_CERRI|nr:hypothetical protein KP509_37G000300 [Ceratopteris richardii]